MANKRNSELVSQQIAKSPASTLRVYLLSTIHYPPSSLLIRLAISAALLGLLFLIAPYLEAQEDIQFNQAGLSVVDPSDAPPLISPFADPPGSDTWPQQ